MKKVHIMHLNSEPYEQIKSGNKTVEVRLHDEKRKKIKVGDEIVFYKGEEGDEKTTVTVMGLRRFKSFEELFSSALRFKTGLSESSPSEAAERMRAYYPKEAEEKYGVLAIEIKIR